MRVWDLAAGRAGGLRRLLVAAWVVGLMAVAAVPAGAVDGVVHRGFGGDRAGGDGLWAFGARVELDAARVELDAARVEPRDAIDAHDSGITLALKGERLWAYQPAAVYRRFDVLELEARDLALGAGEWVVVTLERDPIAGGEREVVHRRAHRATPGRRTVRGTVRLGDAADPLPVGRYRLTLWRQTATGIQPLAEETVHLIFNAHDPTDGDVHRPGGKAWLGGVLQMVQVVGGEFRVNPWRLDIHDPHVFELTMLLIDGAETGAAAAQRLKAGALAHVEGYWPDLVDTRGRIPANNVEADPQWRAGSVTSAAERLRTRDRRGQCFDYAMLYVALLRSAGVPARTVTITSPAPMPHPDEPERWVRWEYHVWAEVSIGGRWWAADLSYLDEPVAERLLPEHDPELQPPHGRWFAQTIDGDARVWIVEGDRLREISDQYGALMRRREVEAVQDWGAQLTVEW